MIKINYWTLNNKIDVDVQNAKESAAKVKGKKVTIAAKAGSNSKLFGSVTAANVAEAVEKQLGVKIDKKKISLSTEIKNFGSYTAALKFYNSISETIDVEVVEGWAVKLWMITTLLPPPANCHTVSRRSSQLLELFCLILPLFQ